MSPLQMINTVPGTDQGSQLIVLFQICRIRPKQGPPMIVADVWWRALPQQKIFSVVSEVALGKFS